MIVPVILSGGTGSRLWPVSRECHPKPFIQMADGETLLAKTYSRASAISDVTEILTVTNRAYYFETRDAHRKSSHNVQCRYLLEPDSRNTAPAFILAAIDVAARHGPDAILLMMPADHLITSVEQFARDVGIAAKAASNGKIVLFGIKPQTPETGYGYIECGPIAETGIAEVRSFKEKPSTETAASYVSSGHHFWNVGIACMTAATALAAFKQHMPTLLAAAQDCWQASSVEPNTSVREFPAAEFAACEAVSLDYAILEKAADVCMLAASFQWSDIGSWMSMAELSPPDPRNNRSEGDVVMIDSDQCYVRGSERLIAMVGTHDLIVIDTPDALLVAHRDKAQQVRQVVAELKAKNHDAARIHRTVARPWGTYTVLDERERYKIKRIEVNCGGSLSLQMHHHRSEHWVVVSGMAKVTGKDGTFFVRTNESTYIPAGQKHRLENPGKIPLVMIEVQSGEYVGEDDIVRFDDIYGRAPKDACNAPI